MESYQPPFTMTEEITNLIVEIGEYVGSISILNSMHKNPVLRRENRIKTTAVPQLFRTAQAEALQWVPSSWARDNRREFRLKTN